MSNQAESTASASSSMTKKPSSSSLQADLLSYLNTHDELNTWTYANEHNIDHQLVVGTIRSIQSIGDIINIEQRQSKSIAPTDEGKTLIANGSYEYNLYQAVPVDKGIEQPELMKLPNSNIGFAKAMSNGWLQVDKSSKPALVKRKVDSAHDEVQNILKRIQSLEISDSNAKEVIDLKKRKLVEDVVINYFIVTKSANFSTDVTKGEAELTAEMLQTGSWKTIQFKNYNFNAKGQLPSYGCLHPLLKVRTEYRQIFLEMGFTEMPTNNFVENSFWNFDALFTPQKHPARDAQDTFFLSDPDVSTKFPTDYLEKIKQVHSIGAFGSIGYQYDWQLEETQKNVFRTHTTAVSTRMLYKLAQEKPFRPAKYFSIDKVFRNENLDATHLAEFHQIEGLVADYNLTLGDLIGVLYQFFRKLGMNKLRFKPAYNPYTEPSMEVFSYHEGLKRWIEVGNSGMFRPEMLLPMGFSEDVSVIAWGLSLERPTMILYGIDNIRSLIGPKVDLEMCQQNPICRVEAVKNEDAKNEA
jgi:phenylalanyl-tRNA synthetase alpha chain